MRKKRQIYTIEVENVFFNYEVGFTFIAISTKQTDQWAEPPDFMRLCFAIENSTETDQEIEGLVRKAIRTKITQQRKERNR